MRMKIVALLSLVSIVSASASAQSLAEVAKKEAERRKAITSPAKVITNADLKPVLRPESAPAPAPSAASKAPESASTSGEAAAGADAAKPAAAPAAADSGGPVKDQAYWSSRLKGLQTQLDLDQKMVSALQSQIDGLWADFTSRSDPVQRADVEKRRNTAIEDQKAANKRVEDGKKKVTDLQEEARQAGVPPGWLR